MSGKSGQRGIRFGGMSEKCGGKASLAVQRVSFLGDDGRAVSLLRPKDLQLIPVPFPLFQGLIVLGEASPPDPAVDDASRPVSAEVKLEPGADRLVSASSRSDWVQILHVREFLGREGSSF